MNDTTQPTLTEKLEGRDIKQITAEYALQRICTLRQDVKDLKKLGTTGALELANYKENVIWMYLKISNQLRSEGDVK